MIQAVGVDMVAKRILWVKARPDYEPLFSILDGLRLDSERRYLIVHNETEGNICDIGVDTGVYKMMDMRLKSEIARLSPGDLNQQSAF